MPGLKAVVFAFAAFRKSGYSFVLPECMERRIPACQHFMNIALVTHVKYDTVIRRIKSAVQRDRQFDNPEIGGQMSPVFRYGMNQFPPDFIRQGA